jgi:hypothetical protein
MLPVWPDLGCKRSHSTLYKLLPMTSFMCQKFCISPFVVGSPRDAATYSHVNCRRPSTERPDRTAVF